jgi:DNA-binding CsgD family transcriptional regulator
VAGFDSLATDWPLVGRSAVLADIEAALRSGGVVLAGPPGVGKTRLAREALERAGAAGRETEWLAATRDSAAIPFGAMAPLLAHDEQLSATPVEFLRRTAHHMAARGNGLPVVIGIDDAHLLDESSASAIHQLTVRGLVSPLASVRAGEPAPDAITALWKDGVVRRMRVRPLGPAAINELLAHSLGPHIEGVTLRRLRTSAAGNPLLLRELLISAYEDGALMRREDVWILDRAPSRGTGLVELVEARLHTLDGATRAVVEIVACGEPLPVAELDRLADAIPLAPGAIEAAERTGLVVGERFGRRRVLRMAHPLHGEVVRGTLPETRARKIWGWLAHGLQGQPLRRRDDALRLARWRLEAGAAAPPEALLDAARQAAEQVDLALAARLVEEAKDAAAGALSDGLPAPGPSRNGADPDASAAESEYAAEPIRRRPDLAAIRLLSLYWGSTVPSGEREPDAKASDGGVQSGDGADDTAAAILQAWALLSEGRCSAALNAIPRDADVPDGSARYARPVAVLANALLGRVDAALAVADTQQAHDHRGRNPVSWGTTLLGWCRCLALRLAGRLGEASALAEEGYAAAVTQGAREVAMGWAGFRGGIARAQGKVAKAQASLREAVAALDGRDAFRLTRHLLADLAGVAALAGDSAAATQWMERADALRDGTNRMFDPWIEVNRAWVMAADGQVAKAARQAQQAAALANALEQYTVEAIALYDSARLGEAPAVLPRLGELAESIDGPLAPALHAAAEALADADGTALDQACAVLDELGFALHAAETAAAAARAHLAAGHPARAAASRTRMTALLDSCEGAGTPLVASRHDPSVSALSPREREIAQLAAAGLSSRIIAERLSLSARTVDNHLGRAYAKLGVANRTQLAILMGGVNGNGHPPRGEPAL